eukprot:6467481-Amphidinium_carterae.2
MAGLWHWQRVACRSRLRRCLRFVTPCEINGYDKQVAMIKKGSVTMPTVGVKTAPKAPSKPSKKADKENDELSLEALLGLR